MDLKFKAPETAPRRTDKTYETLDALKEFTQVAGDPDYTPADSEEKEMIEAFREADGWLLLETFDEPAKAYSRASSLRSAKTLPDGHFEFKGEKVVGDDGEERGNVLARYAGENPVADEPEGEEE